MGELLGVARVEFDQARDRRLDQLVPRAEVVRRRAMGQAGLPLDGALGGGSHAPGPDQVQSRVEQRDAAIGRPVPILLVGGRAAHLLGRRRLFMTALTMFTASRCCAGSRSPRDC